MKKLAKLFAATLPRLLFPWGVCLRLKSKKFILLSPAVPVAVGTVQHVEPEKP